MTMEGSWRSIAARPAIYRKARSSLVRRLIQARNDPAKQRIRRWLSDIDDERLSVFGLTPEDIALANVAWCATSGNRYPTSMLERCFTKHTSKLLDILQPHILLASGTPTRGFQSRIQELLPGSTVIPILHYAHRLGADVERRELAKIRDAIARHSP